MRNTKKSFSVPPAVLGIVFGLVAVVLLLGKRRMA